MKNLWTPWRMAHVLGQEPPLSGCLFEPPGASTANRDQLLLYRDSDNLVLLNRFPYSNGHLLVAPVRHVACLTELNEEETASLLLMVRQSARILKLRLAPHGLNIGCNLGTAAGAGIADHLHFHLVPRWQGDHNFITVLADIRTIPEHIDLTFDCLLPDFLQLHQERQDLQHDHRG